MITGFNGVVVMSHDRYKELMRFEGVLTEEEKGMGYHFCPDWDYLLIGNGMKEMECCTCEL